MAKHRHKFKCRKCGYFVIETDSGEPPPNQQHMFFSAYKLISEKGAIWGDMAIGHGRRREDCSLHVQHVETVAVVAADMNPQQQARNKVLVEGGKYYDRKRRHAKDGAPSMVAVMYDTVTQRWFVGRSGNAGGQGQIPAVVWNRIPADIDPDTYKFGQTCAEVHCLRQAYAARLLADRTRQLENSVFSAYSPLEGRIRVPCGACAVWIRDSGGIAVA